jgi:hypothetical protein
MVSDDVVNSFFITQIIRVLRRKILGNPSISAASLDCGEKSGNILGCASWVGGLIPCP